MDYLIYFAITVIFSVLFGVIGLGSSLVLIPALNLLGVDFNFAKAIGLFVNGTTTLSIGIKNLKYGTLSLSEILPYLIVSIVFSYIGAHATVLLPQNLIQILLLIFIFLSVGIMFVHLGFKISKQHSKFFTAAIVSFIAFIGGLIGVGGGAAYLPVLMLLGFDTKKSIYLTSTLIPFVSFSGFMAYTTFLSINWALVGIVGIAAVIGGMIAHSITRQITNDKFLKIFIAIVLLITGFAMIIKGFL